MASHFSAESVRLSTASSSPASRSTPPPFRREPIPFTAATVFLAFCFDRHFRPAIAQAHRAIEHRATRLGIGIPAEVTLPLELHRIHRIAGGQCRLQPSLSQHL